MLETLTSSISKICTFEAAMNLVVKNLPKSYNAHYLQMLFEPIGEVTDSKVLYDRVTREPKGMGFVEFAKDEDGEKAIELMNGKEIQGQAISVEKAKPRKVNIWG
ncbi:RNA-binding protein [bacterium]|nr:RNA-binding protein [bacterium]